MRPVSSSWCNGQSKYARDAGYQHNIPFLMDSGNEHRHFLQDAHSYLAEKFQKIQPLNVGSLAFDTDDNIRALQAADMIAWSARRRLAGQFKHGFEPLLGIFDGKHIEQPLEEDWMAEVAEAIRDAKKAKGVI